MREDRSDMSEDDDTPDLAAVSTIETSSSNRPRGCSADGEYVSPYPDQVLENVLENVLLFLTNRRDRNAVSLVCKAWYHVEALTRSELFIGNCYAVSPRRVAERFRRVRAVTVKGKPRFADFNLMPPNWGAHFTPWVTAMAYSYRALEKLCLKRMSVKDEDLELLAHFPCFKELVLVCCDGFGTSGLAVVASKCRCLIRYVMKDFKQWLQHVRISVSFGCSLSMLGRILRALFLRQVSKQFPRGVTGCSQFYISVSE
ncbi:hypothetical protein CsSME_00035528 [Camellia sinensis var. sinensis]